MTAPDLRPWSLGELLDQPFTLYRSHFPLFMGIMAVPQLLLVMVNLIAQSWMSPIMATPAARHAPQDPAAMMRNMGVFFGGFALIWIAHYVLYAVALGATTFAVAELYFGRTITIRSAYRSMAARFWALLGLLLVMFLMLVVGYFFMAFAALVVGFVGALLFGPAAVVVGFLAGISVIIWLLLHLGLAIPALLLEKADVFQAIGRSIKLTKGHVGRVFLTALLMGIVTYEFIAVFQGPFFVAMALAKDSQLSLWARNLMVVCGGAGGALSGPLLMIGLSLLYYDMRVRKEALDLQVKMAAIAPAPAAPGT